MAYVRPIWWAVVTAALLLALAFGSSVVVLAFGASQSIHMHDDCWTSRYCI